MAKDFAKAFYKSVAWKRCREEFMRSKGELCEDCIKMGRVTPAKVVHHRITLTQENINVPSVSLNFENLKAVCQDCHALEHTGAKWGFSEDGTVIRL